ncbi:unnamed protein product [Staurois parvus]|uniref:Uncharacterized protein n=1 Tax=Staurois parvus TaxID=386267 RepID=A0ABN9C4Q9_9NEOB|nr:unnamed protein product [Staurois parvus]
MWFDPIVSDPPLLPVSPSYLLIRHRVETLCTSSVWCVLLEVFGFLLGRVHVISTGPISTAQTERGSASS